MKGPASFVAALAFAGATPALAGEAAPPTKPASSVAEVVVTAERPAAQTLIDRKVYSLARDLQATTGSAADILNKVPSVAVDADGNISLRGDGNVTVLVDGKPSAQFSGPARGLSLQQFQASDIDRVEVLTTPPAQFKAEGSGGVINIVTRKTRRAGLSGTSQLSLGDKRRYVANLNMTYNAGRLRLSGGLGLRQDARNRLTASNRVVPDPISNLAVASQQTVREQQRRLVPSVKGQLDFDLNARQSLSAAFSRRELNGVRFFDQHDVSGPAGGPATSLSDRHSDGHDWSVDASESLRFDQKLWRPKETLSLAVQRSVSREREGYVYRNTFALPVQAPTFDQLHLSFDLVKTEVSADYDLPLASGREIKFGYDLEDDRNAFDPIGETLNPLTGGRMSNPDVTNHFRYRQRVNAAYGQYQAPLGPWQMQAGLRLEAARASTLQLAGNIPGGRKDSGAYPSFHLERSVGDTGKLSLGIGRRLTRPDPELLNPSIDHQDTHNLRAGNPNLAPQDTWSYEVGYNGAMRAVTYGVTAYVKFDRNSLTDVVRPVSDDVVLTTKANLPKSRSAGVEFTANGKLGAALSYGLSGDLFTAQIDATALGAPGLKSTTGVNLKASLDWRATAVDTAQVSMTRQARRLTPQGYVAAVNLVNLGYRRQLRPDLAVVVTVSDVFNGQKQRRLITTPQLRDTYERDQRGRLAYVGLVYTFGGPAKARAKSFEYEQ